MTKRSIDLVEIEDLVLNKEYVFLKTDSGYDPDKKNSIKDHYGLSTIQAQAVKRDPIVQEFIKSMSSTEIKVIDSRKNNNNETPVTTVTAEMV